MVPGEDKHFRGGDHGGLAGSGPLPPSLSAVPVGMPPTAQPTALTRTAVPASDCLVRLLTRCLCFARARFAHSVGGVLVMQTLRFDPFRDFDRLAAEVLGTARTPALMPMDCLRTGDQFVVRFDLPGIDADSLEVSAENQTLTVRAERTRHDP